ncbi:MAG TPA: queuosine precursor transporter [Kofleriaceae bacterium]|nr:queuosine precursor transporter [Kofleriaceae bacterium]
MTLDARLKLFLFLACLFVTSLLVGDLIGGKLYQSDVGGLSMLISVGMIPFPIVFLLTDLINEFYGARVARYVTLVGFVMAWFTIGILTVAGVVPWAPITTGADWTGVRQASFDNIFASSRWILICSTVAYLTGQLIDISIFHVIRRRLHGRLLWLRATGSTVVSQLIDTFVINMLVWYKQMPFSSLVTIMATSYLVKVVAALALTPLIYAGHAVVERGLHLEPYRADET